jgi:ubiquinone/menaquinone biosynthesis C-methylase UbiE
MAVTLPELSAGHARATYEAAAEHFDGTPLRFWDRYGQATVARIGLARGARVLDVCCGAGGSALPAARAVGREGSVIGVDLSDSLLALGRRKAQREGLRNVDFRIGDMTALALPPGSFDAVVIVFGVFFAPDMAAQVRALARLLRPGGTLAITTWGPRLFGPLYADFLQSVRRLAPDLPEYRPWDRLSTRDEISALLSGAGLRDSAIDAEAGHEPLACPEDWWSIVLGTGLRWFVDQLDGRRADALRRACLERARAVRSVETNVIYAVART